MPERTPPGTPAEGLGRYLAALRRWAFLAAAIVAAGALAGLVVAMQLPKSYEATAKVLLDQQRQVDALLGTSDFSPDPERELNTGVQLITLEPIADSVRRSLRLREPAAALAGRVTTAVDRNSNIVWITVRDTGAARAARIANAFADGYRDFRARSARAGVEDATAAARARVAQLAPGRERAALQRQLRRLEVAAAFQTGGVQVVHRATARSATSHPRPLASAFAGGFLGLVIAAITIILLARTDTRVRSDGDIEGATGHSVVARIPSSRAAAQDALATLAVAIERPRADLPPPRVVLVTSAGPGEGAPEIALGLARGRACIGRQTIVIDADMRGPASGRMLELDDSEGLAAILDGAGELDRELVDAEEGFAVLPAGITARPPQALLAGDRMAATVAEARSRADAVIVTCAPAGMVGDALALAGVADAALLVARRDVTRRDELERAARLLGDAGLRTLGVVVTGNRRRGPIGRALRSLLRAREPAAYDRPVAPLGASAAGATSEVAG